MNKRSETGLNLLEPFDAETGDLNAVVETPKGSRNKYKFDEHLGVFKLGGILTVGAVFPFDFGYIPNTRGGDGDPLDVLILMDEPAFTGCVIPARLIGVIEARQTEDNKTERNDRLIALASDSHNYMEVKSLNDLNQILVDQIEHFFISYNEAKGKKFEPIGRFGARKARSLVETGIKLYKSSENEK